MFDAGRKVEVSFDTEDFQDAWFPATIRENLGNGTFSVGYSNANNDSNGVYPDVTVDSLHIRPCPPLLEDMNFVLLEKVDAFFDLGWWSGIVTKQLERSRYLVFFKKMKCNKEFNQSELRLHMDWKDGKWFASSRSQEPPNPFLDVPFLDDAVCQHPTLENTSASVTTAASKNSNDGEDTDGGRTHPSLISRKDHVEPFVPDNMNLVDFTIPLRKRRTYIDSGSAPSQPCKELKDENLAGENKKARHDGSEKEQRKQRNSQTPQNFGGKFISIASSLRKRSAQMLTLESLEIDAGDKEPDASGRTEELAQSCHEKQETGLHVVIGLPCAEAGSGFGISGGRRTQLSKKKTVAIVDDVKKAHDYTNQKIKDGKQSVIGKARYRRKKGIPKRNLVESTETLVTVGSREFDSGDTTIKDDDSDRIFEVPYIGMEASIFNQEDTAANQENTTANQEKKCNSQFAPWKRKVGITKWKQDSKHKNNNLEESVRPGVNHSWKRGRKHISSHKISVKVRDLVVASGSELAVVSHAMEVEKSVEPSGNEFKNEPLSKWIEDMNMSFAIGNSKTLPVNGDNQTTAVVFGEASDKQTESEKQSLILVARGDIASTEPQSLPSVNSSVAVVLEEATQKQFKSGTQTTSLVDKERTVVSLDLDSQKQPENGSSVEKTVDIVPNEDNEKQPENGTALIQIDPENLPFVKKTILWKTLETMEVFRKMPQKPHFQPLANLKESSREGVAIGYMVTFSSLVEKPCRLLITDPISTMLDIKESLAELEQHGFDARAVDGCINQLLTVKNREEKLVHDATTIDNKITLHNNNKTQVERDIDEMNEQIAMLQKKLSLAKSAKKQKDVEIAFLMVRQRETNDNIEILKREFKGIVSSIL